MAFLTLPRSTILDLWARATAELSEEDRQHINFSRPEKLNALADLTALVHSSTEKCISKRWRYTRKSGEIVIFRDIFAKVIKWIDLFKQIGDVAVQYDPAHAALPWAAVRFILQIALNDHNKFASMIEGVAAITEMICRCALIESLYPKSTSTAYEELERALVKLYAAIMIYLSRARKYFETNSAKRTIVSGLLANSNFDSYFASIRAAQSEVDRCLHFVDRRDQVDNHANLIRLLKKIDAPLIRISDSLKNIQDNLEVSTRTKILRWLSPEPYLQHHEEIKKDVLPGTGTWLLSDPIYKEWKTGSASSILWLYGIHGSGKSKLVSVVIEDVMQDFSAGHTPRPAFFYCSRNPAEQTRSDPKSILASIARQLSNLLPPSPILKAAIEVYRKKEAEGFASGPLRIEESRDLIIQLIDQYPLATIVIDALDECNPETRTELLDVLEKILQESSNLVKIFVSSRSEHDIVFQLQHYPGLELNSKRNSSDIRAFVQSETDRLIEKNKLLRHSRAKKKMEKLIVEKLAQDAQGMFRWASLQLQYLCSFRIDAEIHDRLGRLPPTLESIYSEMYNTLYTGLSELEKSILRSVLYWLLTAEKALSTDKFLEFISISSNSGREPISMDQVLEICNNFVVFDSHLDTFRFAHLSVREFLEKRPEFASIACHAWVTEICLLSLISVTPKPEAKTFLSKHGRAALKNESHLLKYSIKYWPIHCQLAAEARSYDTLKEIFAFFLSNTQDPTSPFHIWVEELWPKLSGIMEMDFWPKFDCLGQVEFYQSRGRPAIFLSAAFDFVEVFDAYGEGELSLARLINGAGKELLELCIANRSYKTMRLLLDPGRGDVKITEDVILRALNDPGHGMEIMTLFLDYRAGEVEITEAVLAAAVAKRCFMELLLEKRRDEIDITKAVKAVLQKEYRVVSHDWKDIMMLLLDQKEDEVMITGEMLSVAARCYGGRDKITFLMDTRRVEMKTSEVVEAAVWSFKNGEDILSRLIDRRGKGIEIIDMVARAVLKYRTDENCLIQHLLAGREERVKITVDLIRAVVGRWSLGKDTEQFLLDERGEVMITTGAIRAEGEIRGGKDIIKLLLNESGFRITEDMVPQIAQCYDEEVMALLLDRRGDEVKITEEVVKAAATNGLSGEKVLRLLLQQRGDEVEITEEVVKAAATNSSSGKEVLRLLLQQRGDEVKITKEVFEAIAKNESSGKDIVTLLLEIRGDDLPKTLFYKFEHLSHTLSRFKLRENWHYIRNAVSHGAGGISRKSYKLL